MMRTLFVTALMSLLATPGQAAPKKLLLIGQGPDGHPPATHEYLPGVKIVQKLLEKLPDLEITVVNANEPWKDGPELIERSDAVVIFVSEGGKWLQSDPRRLKALLGVVDRGGGVSVLHWGMGTREAANIEGCLKLYGACHGGPDRKYKVIEEAEVAVAPKHAATTGLEDFKIKDEFYYQLKQTKEKGLVPLLTVPIDGKRELVAWAWERPAGGRAFGFSGLHFHDNWSRPEYRRLVAQAVLWTLKLPVPEKGLNVDIAEEALRLK
ncbi:MAG: ThuA domain-containing protein [Gemmataceae bacterium]